MMKNAYTKKEIMMAIKFFMENVEEGYEIAEGAVITPEDVIAFADKFIEQLDAKAEKAKETNRKKKTEDKLKEMVYNAIGEDFTSLDDIVAAVPETYEEGTKTVEVTKAKVVARLTALVKEGKVEKDALKVDGRTVKVYRLAKGGVIT